MLPFEIHLKHGTPVYEQVLYAAKKAIVSGQLRPDDAFPSVRAISKELKVNPNTVQKAISVLKREGFLEVRPGVGTIVALPHRPDPEQQTALLGGELEALVVKAKEFSLSLDDVTKALRKHWKEL
ncbi:MAG: GntR family transcriptional regulator [Verrucomicrobiae bacterium]|jgi:GntR family transcriptional regulator|nr:GntR family transcriptional regulator [Verrucomicrobiae bacterium]